MATELDITPILNSLAASAFGGGQPSRGGAPATASFGGSPLLGDLVSLISRERGRKNGTTRGRTRGGDGLGERAPETGIPAGRLGRNLQRALMSMMPAPLQMVMLAGRALESFRDPFLTENPVQLFEDLRRAGFNVDPRETGLSGRDVFGDPFSTAISGLSQADFPSLDFGFDGGGGDGGFGGSAGGGGFGDPSDFGDGGGTPF